MSLLRDCQLDIMLFLIGVCTVLSLSILVAKPIPAKSRGILAGMAVASAMLLVFERIAYMFRGDVSELGYNMVRIGNGLSFFFLLLIPFLVTQYLKDLYGKNDDDVGKTSAVLKAADAAFAVGALLLLVSQFTGLYYTFDATNTYQRSDWLVLSYIPPLAMVTFQVISLIWERRCLSREMFAALLMSLVLPIAAAIGQLFAYGISLTCLVTASVVIIYYIFMMGEIYETAEHAKDQEIEFYKRARKMESDMFEQTVEALVNAIDAKDICTRGHSVRVAYYSRQIAERAELGEEDRDKLYFTALLHDIGKIGILDSIINKPGSLTDDEYEEVKAHTIMGEQILSSIKLAPYLGIGAHYHHERYDGKGYPEGLAGEDIPEVARIIAVADAYDVMTSRRSYHKPMPMEDVKKEIVEGSGTQFDPRFAAIMLEIIEEGKTHRYREDDDQD